uniref:Uncharacterized protein n=1 Tax=Anguilla anguilla TaxID=7936 RepID=A0A0E9T7S2_ANGAN
MFGGEGVILFHFSKSKTKLRKSVCCG